MSRPHFKDNVVLENISTDGAQRYRFGPGITDVITLTGWNRASGVNVGDKGSMEYRSTPSQGLWWFMKNKDNE
jgi:hypothetical protein